MDSAHICTGCVPQSTYREISPDRVMAVLKRPTFWAPDPQMPTAEFIRAVAEQDALESGRRCHRSGGVISAAIRRNLAWATVRHAGGAYRVVAPLNNYTIPYCPCGPNRRRACAHGVATLLHVMGHFETMIQDDPWKGAPDTVARISEDALRAFVMEALAEGIRPSGMPEPGRVAIPARSPAGSPRAAGGVSGAGLRRFVADMISEGGRGRALFAARFGEPDLPDHHDCRAELDYMFAESYQVWDLPRIRFAYPFRVAKAHESRGDWAEAVRTYREVSEAIMINGDGMEDEDNHYSSAHAKALDGMVSCVRRHLPEPAQRRPHIRYLHGMFADRRYGWFLKNYRAALSRICTAREDLEYWQGLHMHLMERGRAAYIQTWHRGEAELMQEEIFDRLTAAGSPGRRAGRRRGAGGRRAAIS